MGSTSNCHLILGCSILFVATAVVRSHEVVVHRKITEAASASAPGFQQFLVDLFGEGADDRQKSPVFGRFNAYGWLEEGSELEDMDTHYGFSAVAPQQAQWRVLNHFYDPYTKRGLTDGGDLWAESSFDWAARKGGNRPPQSPFKNDYSWTEAREYQRLALTAQSKASRDQNFGLTFRSVGQVMHLNQDLTQPSHVRNDNHFFERNGDDFIEKYGARHATDGTIVYPQVFLDWRAAGYTSLRQFWDNLAFYVNRNFLSGDSKYKELHKVGKVHYYPLPSLQTGTDFPQMQGSQA